LLDRIAVTLEKMEKNMNDPELENIATALNKIERLIENRP